MIVLRVQNTRPKRPDFRPRLAWSGKPTQDSGAQERYFECVGGLRHVLHLLSRRSLSTPHRPLRHRSEIITVTPLPAFGIDRKDTILSGYRGGGPGPPPGRPCLRWPPWLRPGLGLRRCGVGGRAGRPEAGSIGIWAGTGCHTTRCSGVRV